jgi:hypothetical protein
MKKLGLIIFILSLSIGISAALSCSFGNFNNGGNSVSGSGNVRSENRDVSGFKEISAGGAVNLQINVGSDFAVEVEADDNILPLIKTEISGDTLKIFTEGRISPKNTIRVKISMPELVDLDISGASSAEAANVKTDSLKLNASGASKIKIDGAVKSLDADASGASTINAENLQTENADVDSGGASNVTVSPSGDLNAHASGASRILYTVEPKNIKQNSSGASSIKKK